MNDTTLKAESEKELKNLLMRVKEESEKAGLKLNIKKKLTSWHQASLLHGKLEGEKVDAVTDFLFWGPKITVDGDCSHEIRGLLFSRKAMANQDMVLKSKDITLPTKVCIIKAVVFPVVTYDFGSWTIKQTERKNRCL